MENEVNERHIITVEDIPDHIEYIVASSASVTHSKGLIMQVWIHEDYIDFEVRKNGKVEHAGDVLGVAIKVYNRLPWVIIELRRLIDYVT